MAGETWNFFDKKIYCQLTIFDSFFHFYKNGRDHLKKHTSASNYTNKFLLETYYDGHKEAQNKKSTGKQLRR